MTATCSIPPQHFSALSMTHAGARGETESQMTDTLRFSLPQDRLHPTFNVLDQELATRGRRGEDGEGKGFSLNIANAVWGQKDHEFLEAFLDTLADSYGAGVRPLDFRGSPEESQDRHERLGRGTHGRPIKDLIPPTSSTL